MAMSIMSPLKSGESNSKLSSLTEDLQIKFNRYVTKAKTLVREGKIKEALEYNERALAIYHSEKLVRRITKMKEYLAQSSGEDDDEMVHVGDGFYLFHDLYNKLYRHQREGILWLWKIHKTKRGGILGDDMGLGKTIQVIAFLSGLFDAELCHSVLIILPVAVIINWEKEFAKWAPGIRVVAFHGTSKRDRLRALSKVHRCGGVVLTSYGMVISNIDQLSEKDDREFVWDYVILDEGHKIKNPCTKGSKAIHRLAAKHRLILTGTPVQNNLKEMWALFDWTHQGTLLGTARTFSMQYEQPIIRSRQKDATAGEQHLGAQMANSLKKIISPFFLRRTKAEVSREQKENHDNSDGKQKEDAPEMPKFTRKNDLICWVYLSEVQQKIYEAFVQTEEVRYLLNSTRSPLTALVVLKKICDHPRLMTMRQCMAVGIEMDDVMKNMDDIDEVMSKECAASRIKHLDDEVLVSESGKMVFLVQLLDNLRSEGHRALVFSQSRRMLDIIQKVMTARGHKVARLDGTVRLLEEREEIIKKFSRDKSYSIFLLTTQVGGVGLTLTAADRVIIFDPSWNPATDAQAVDRAFRIGQEKNVVIYRLITCGSIEEKVYRRQIFKESITKQTTGESKNPFRYFSRQDLHELFVLDNPRYSATQVQLQEIHNNQRKSDTALDEHLAFLYSLDMFGVSDHDLMFSQEAHNSEEETDAGHEYINKRVTDAQEAIAQESAQNYQLTQQLGRYPAPEVNQPRNSKKTTNEGVPPRPHMPHSLTNDYHIKSETEEQDSYEEDVNKSMKDLTIIEVGSDLSSSSDEAQEVSVTSGQLQPDFSPDEESPTKTANTDHREAKTLTVSSTMDQLQPSADNDSQLLHDQADHSGSIQNVGQNSQPIVNTPSRRRSVCVSCTPIRKFSSEELIECTNKLDTPEADIVQEELIISPRPTEPVLNTLQPKNMLDQFGNEMEYETFVNSVPMNSTVLAASKGLMKFSVDALTEEDEVTGGVLMTDDDSDGVGVGYDHSSTSSLPLKEGTQHDEMSELRVDNTDTDVVLDSENEEQEEMIIGESVTNESINAESSIRNKGDSSSNMKANEDQKAHWDDDNEVNHDENIDNGNDLQYKDNEENVEEDYQEDGESDSESEEEISEDDRQRYIDLMSHSR